MPSRATGSTGARRPRPGPTCGCRGPTGRSAPGCCLIPCWWGLLLAAAADPAGLGGFDLWIALGCALGALLMRGAGCTWNDLTDRDIDAAVARTRSRPLPSGQVTPRQAAGWMLAQALLAFAILLSFPPEAVALGIGSLALVAVYPFAKRFTWWPQVFLGLAFNWGALLAWAAHARGAVGGAAPALCGRHRLDPVLRHHLRPSGPRGRRADRGEVDGAAVRDPHQALAARASCSPRPRWRRWRWRPPGWRGRRCAAALLGVTGFAAASGLAAAPARHRRRGRAACCSSAPTATPG